MRRKDGCHIYLSGRALKPCVLGSIPRDCHSSTYNNKVSSTEHVYFGRYIVYLTKSA